jgi:hypothetical protein
MTRIRTSLFLVFLVAPVVIAVIAAERTPATMSAAASKWLASLSSEQKQKGAFPFEGSERSHWGFVPTEMFPRNGLTIKEMSAAQRQLAHELLKSGLSQRGYLTATTIMDLEHILKITDSATLVRDQERYFFSVFGTPADRGAWGWRVEGHHISLNFTVINGALMAGAPTFFGSNPAEVREVPAGANAAAPKVGTRILGAQEDPARALFLGLNAAAQQKALLNAVAPRDIVTMNQVDIKPLSPAGIAASELSASQRTLLRQIIESYTTLMEADIAKERMARIDKAGFDKVTFTWAGETERGKKNYYRVQGPTFLIEYDNTQNDGNHVHSVWREFDGDFGRDILREHLKTVAH